MDSATSKKSKKRSEMIHKNKMLPSKSSQIKYPISIHYLDDGNNGGYYFAYLLDFGVSVCSATGDTAYEALRNLERVQCNVIKYFKKIGRQLPIPSPNPALTDGHKSKKICEYSKDGCANASKCCMKPCRSKSNYNIHCRV